jgi:hypothetical protein
MPGSLLFFGADPEDEVEGELKYRAFAAAIAAGEGSLLEAVVVDDEYERPGGLGTWL